MQRGLLLACLVAGWPSCPLSARVKTKVEELLGNSQDSDSKTQSIQSGMVLHNRFRLERRLGDFRGNVEESAPTTIHAPVTRSVPATVLASSSILPPVRVTTRTMAPTTVASVVAPPTRTAWGPNPIGVQRPVFQQVNPFTGRPAMWTQPAEARVVPPIATSTRVTVLPQATAPANGFAIPATSVATAIGQAPRVVLPFKERPEKEFPPGTIFQDQNIQEDKHLRAGQFGDVWRATDLDEGVEVAVKIFYKHTGLHPPHDMAYLTWNTAEEPHREEMRKSIRECAAVQDIIAAGSEFYPVGASRICECKHEYIRQGETNPSSVMYTVWEMCGNTDMTGFREAMAGMGAVERIHKARELTKQVAEAVALLSMFKTPTIHHDLKADNVVLFDNTGEFNVKVIDFGCFVIADPSSKGSYTIGDPTYMPPEHSLFNAFDYPPSSFDMYGVGLIYMELLCPGLEHEDWDPMRLATPETMLGKKPVLDFGIVKEAMLKKCPEIIEVLRGESVPNDLSIIDALTTELAIQRLSPEEAIESIESLEKENMRAERRNHASRRFNVGDQVQALRRGAWKDASIVRAMQASYLIKFNDDGATVEAALEKVRAQSAIPSLKPTDRAPVVGLFFDVNDEVEYFSAKAGWVDCVVSATNARADTWSFPTYDLTCGDGLREQVRPEKVRQRAFPPGTNVWLHGVIQGIVESYDPSREVYRLRNPANRLASYPDCHRDAVTLRA